MSKIKFIIPFLGFLITLLSSSLNAQVSITGPGTVCAGTASSFFVSGLNRDLNYSVSVSGGSASPSLITNSTTVLLTVFWNPNNCSSTTGFGTGNISVSSATSSGSLPVTILGVGAPGAVTGPGSIGCGTNSFVLSVTPGAGATGHIWTGIPTGWTVSCNNAVCSSITVTIPAGDCNNYNLNINAIAVRAACGSLACPSPIPLTLVRNVIPVPVVNTGCPLLCNIGEQTSFTLSNLSAYTSVSWSTTGSLSGIGDNSGATYTVEATASTGSGNVYCTVSNGCCTNTFLITKVNFGPPTLTYLDIAENLCPEYSAETNLLGCNADRYIWKWYKEPYTGFYNTKSTTANSTKLVFTDGPGTYRVAVSASNRCGTSNEVIARVVVPDCRGNDGGGHLIGDGTDRSDNESVVEKVTENGIKAATLLEPEIYPNPTEGSFTIKIPNDFYNVQQYSIKIFDGLGKCLFDQQDITELQYNITNWQHEPGIYFVQIQAGNAISVTKKLVVQ